MTAMILTFHLSFFVCIRIIFIYIYIHTHIHIIHTYIIIYIYVYTYIYTHSIYIYTSYIYTWFYPLVLSSVSLMMLVSAAIATIAGDRPRCPCNHSGQSLHHGLASWVCSRQPMGFGTLGLECLEKRRFQLQTLRFYGYLMLYPKSFSKSRGLPMVSFNVFAVLFCSKHPAAHGRWWPNCTRHFWPGARWGPWQVPWVVPCSV